MTSDAERATQMAEAKVAKQLGLDEEQVERFLRPAIAKCAKAASAIIGEPVEPSLEKIMALGPEVMVEVQKILKEEFSKVGAAKKADRAGGSFDRAPKKNKFV